MIVKRRLNRVLRHAFILHAAAMSLERRGSISEDLVERVEELAGDAARCYRHNFPVAAANLTATCDGDEQAAAQMLSQAEQDLTAALDRWYRTPRRRRLRALARSCGRTTATIMESAVADMHEKFSRAPAIGVPA